jgi:hypothetical protein
MCFENVEDSINSIKEEFKCVERGGKIKEFS